MDTWQSKKKFVHKERQIPFKSVEKSLCNYLLLGTTHKKKTNMTKDSLSSSLLRCNDGNHSTQVEIKRKPLWLLIPYHLVYSQAVDLEN